MSQASGVLVSPASRVWLPPLLLGGAGGLAAALAIALADGVGLGVAIVLGGLSLAVAAAAMRPGALLVAFAVLLPVHLPAMVLLFNAGVDHSVLRAFSAWKEAVALGLLGVLVMQHVAAGRMPRWRALDVLVLAFAALNVLYALVPFTAPISVPLGMRLHGLRDNAFFVVLYLIGRLAPLTVRHARLFAAVVIGVGVAGVALGLLERFALPLSFFFETLHYDDFSRDYLNLHYYTGIPYNFWTSVGNVRRGVSFYLGSHHFAMAAALVLPLVLVLRRPLRPFPAALRTPLLLLAIIGLALPLTRSVMLACLLQVLMIGWLTRRPHYALTAALSVMLLLGSSYLFLDLSGYVQDVAASPSSSVATHVASWENTRAIVRAYPFGAGIGVVDTVAGRTGGVSGLLSGEGEYSLVATSVGIPGLLLFVAMLATTAVTMLRTWRSAADAPVRQLALVTLALLVGFVVAGAFTQVRHVPAFLFPLWWLVGAVTSGAPAGDRDARRPSPAPAGAAA